MNKHLQKWIAILILACAVPATAHAQNGPTADCYSEDRSECPPMPRPDRENYPPPPRPDYMK